MQTLIHGWQVLRRLMKQAGPYLLLELLLPGGTLLTICLMMYRSGALTALQPVPVMHRDTAQVQVLMHRPAEKVLA